MNSLRQDVRDVRWLLAWPFLWALMTLTLVGATGAYQVRQAYSVDVGSPGDQPYISNFHAPFVDTLHGRTFRWSDAYSYVVLPGIGGGVPYSVTLSLDPGQANVPVTIFVNGEIFLQRALANGWHNYTFSIDTAHPLAMSARDLVVEIRAPSGGVMLDRVQVSPPGSGFVVPALGQLISLTILVVLTYLLLGRWRYRVSAGRREPNDRLLPLAGATVPACILVALLAAPRLPLTVLTGSLVAGTLILHGLLTLRHHAPLYRWLRAESHIVRRLVARPLVWAVVALALLGLTMAYQVRHEYNIDVGSPQDQAYVHNFRDGELEQGTNRLFRRGGTDSYVALPGIGGGVPYSVTVTLNPGHPGVPVTMNVNGETFFQGTLLNGWQSYTFLIDAAHPRALASPDLRLDIRPRPSTELQLDQVQVSAGGAGFVIPAPDQLVGLTAILILTYLLLGRALASFSRAALTAALGTLLVACGLVGSFAAGGAAVAVATPHLVLTGLFTYGLLIVTEPLARRVVPGAPRGARVAAALVAGGFLVRFGVMELPETVVIDMGYHIRWLHELLAGNWDALTDPHGGLNRPPRRWGLGVFIPKSALFYVVASPLAWLPIDLDTALSAFVCLLEASTALFCYG
ncbi:MAG: hypothetical protein M3014_15590, partial [Chloroflexota bacterium]|nr:hypothetical protein [Chloroflexota bacterium]